MEKVLSIIIPTYNAEKFLDKGLTSYIMEDENLMNKLEVIVVNDGTPDNSVAVAQKYVDMHPNVFSIINKENGGHGSGINVGVEHVNGKYFKVIDADDWVLTDALERLIKYLEEIETVEAVITSYYTYDISKDYLELQDVQVPDYDKVYNLEELMPYWGDIHLGFSFHGLVYNTAFYKKIGYKVVEKAFYEDQEYASIPLSWASQIRILRDPMYMYRIGDVGQSVATTSQLNRLPDFEKVLWKMMEFESELDKLPPGGREHWARKVSKFIASVYHICMIKNPDKKSKREYLEWFNAEIKKRSPYIYSCVENKYKVFKLFNKVHMSEDFYAFVFGPALKFAKKYLGVGKLYV